MWAIAAGLWAGLKWATLVAAWRVGLRPSVRRVFAYMLAWPNTDALSFLNQAEVPDRPGVRDWFSGFANTFLGIVLLYTGVRLTYRVSPQLSGWIGMIGLVFILHFGIFKLLALAWRHAGTNATLLMRCPIASRSLAEFWGRRWNTGFSGPARSLLHAPLAKRIGPSLATMCVFLVSGLVHESVISLPAGGGYGLPTAYFLLQAVGLQIERSRVGRRLGLGRGFRGWAFALLMMAAGPALLLFHPFFVREVILPFLAAIGALKGVAL
jgi:alginate O-acetyltransferase complex protein AlgI